MAKTRLKGAARAEASAVPPQATIEGDEATRLLYVEAVQLSNANVVSQETGIPRSTIVSVLAGTARPGSLALAEKHRPRVVALIGRIKSGPRAA